MAEYTFDDMLITISKAVKKLHSLRGIQLIEIKATRHAGCRLANDDGCNTLALGSTHYLVVYHHDVQHRVTEGVLGVGVGAALNEEVVYLGVVEHGRDGQRVLPVVSKRCNETTERIDV